jgi:Pectate lyase superfamily protein
MRRFHHRVVLSVLIAVGLSLPASSAFAQASAPFNVRSYGASGVGNCAVDTPAVSNAFFAAFAAGGGEIYFPAGTYCMSGTLGVTNYSIALRGEGKNLSIIRWDAGGDGLAFTSTTSPHKTLTVKSLSFISNKDFTGSAIHGYWSSSATADGPTASITDVHIGHLSPTVWHGWIRGIHLENGTRSVITNFDIDNPSPDAGSSTAAIRLSGQSLQSTITAGAITFWWDGIQFVDQSEGLHVSDVEIVGIRRGIVLDTTAILPGTSIANNHINASDRGIYMWQRNDVNISGNLIYSTTYSTNFMGIEAIHCNAMRITGNYIVRLGTSGNYNGIVLEGNATRNVISNNVTEHMDAGIWLVGTGVSATNTVGNINRNYTVSPYLDWGSPGANQQAANF